MDENHDELVTRKLELEVLDLLVNKGLGKIREQIEKEEEAPTEWESI